MHVRTCSDSMFGIKLKTFYHEASAVDVITISIAGEFMSIKIRVRVRTISSGRLPPRNRCRRRHYYNTL